MISINDYILMFVLIRHYNLNISNSDKLFPCITRSEYYPNMLRLVGWLIVSSATLSNVSAISWLSVYCVFNTGDLVIY